MSPLQSLSGAPELLVVVGPTASGKTELAIELAQYYGGEIICADSRTIYEGLDIGTAKPTRVEQSKVPHWGLDIVDPGQPFTVADFQLYAKRAIQDIRKRQKLPILCGGSGLYIDSVVYDYSFAPPNPSLRTELTTASIEELQRLIRLRGLVMPENSRNKRYLLRTLERGSVQPSKSLIDEQTLVIGLDPGRDVLLERIERRANEMVALGVEQEIRQALESYGANTRALNGGIYSALKNYLLGLEPFDEALRRFIRSDMSLAKRQRTWFRRYGEQIYWFTSVRAAADWLKAVE